MARAISTTVLSENDFKNIVNSYRKQKRTFEVHLTREKNLYLYEKEKLIFRGKKGRKTETKLPDIEEGSSIFGKGITWSQGLAVVTRVKSEVRNYLCNVVKPEVIDAKYSTVGRNQNVFKEIENGSVFYSVDINHAYFQVLRNLGYITDSFYDAYKDQDEYKKAFHFSCSWLVTRAKIYKYRMGVLIGMVDKKKDEKQLKIIYDNVRHTLQNLLGELYEQLDSGAVAYLTDEIFIKKEALPFVKQYFKESGYEFKITICRKMDNMQFNKANQKIHKLFGRNAEGAKDSGEKRDTQAAVQREMESDLRVREIMKQSNQRKGK